MIKVRRQNVGKALRGIAHPIFRQAKLVGNRFHCLSQLPHITSEHKHVYITCGAAGPEMQEHRRPSNQDDIERR